MNREIAFEVPSAGGDTKEYSHNSCTKGFDVGVVIEIDTKAVKTPM